MPVHLSLSVHPFVPYDLLIWKLHRVWKKNIPNTIDCHLTKRYPLLIILGTFIFGITGHQMTVQNITSPSVCFCTTWGRQNQRNASWNEQKYAKSIPIIINCDLKEGLTDFNNFWCKHFWHYRTCHQITVLIPTSANVCLCTTWENPNRWNRTKMQYIVGFVSPGSAETDNGCGRKLDNHLIASCVRNISVKNY